jgi:hypothetical protein
VSDERVGWTELHRSFGDTENWKVDRDCVYLNGERIINGCEIGCPSDNGRRYLVSGTRHQEVFVGVVVKAHGPDSTPKACVCLHVRVLSGLCQHFLLEISFE